MTEVRNRRLTIKLYRGDITSLAVDAIVSSGNSRLWMGGGVAGAIKRAAGKSVADAAAAKGPIPVGEAAVTRGGALKATYVIHAATTGMDFVAYPEMVRSAVVIG